MPVSSPVSRPTRLTRLGRVVTAVLLVAALCAAFVVGRTTSAAGDVPAANRTVVVQPGDTLWALATRIDAQADPRVTVVRLEQLNHLGTAAVRAGQILRLPRG